MTRVLRGIGLMSGSSLDGLDAALCHFRMENNQLRELEICQGVTLPFPDSWSERLRQLPQSSGKELLHTHVEFGRWMGQQVVGLDWKADFVASHGHTVFHFPDKGFTYQLGDGAALAAITELPVVCDFRSLDLALGGQGAPLAPTVDKCLPGYDLYLNIGGIANISTVINGRWVAFDIGPANQIFDRLAAEAGRSMDENGDLARRGRLNQSLLNTVNSLPYFNQPFPKSLGNDWVVDTVWPLYQREECSVEDRLQTAVSQLVQQTLAAVEGLSPATGKKMLVSGGGALNTYLIECLQKALDPMGVKVVVPDVLMVSFKEALLIALLGALRLWKIPNVQSSATGAVRDSVGGAVYWGKSERKHEG